MSQYLITLVAVSALAGISAYASYGEREEKGAKFAMALILVYVTVAPVITLFYSFVTDVFYSYGEQAPDISVEDTEFAENAEEAFALGIKKLLREDFSVEESDSEVLLFGFDSIKMRAEKIKIVLKGKGALADNRGIVERIEEMNIGKCEVELYVK